MRKSLHSKDHETLIALLREFREDAGLTQVELAKRLGEAQSLVSKCEIGERRLDVLELRQWCQALGIDLDDFVKALQKRLPRKQP